MDYKNGKIYRVVCSATGRQYIGSTVSTLVKRLYQHRCKNNGCMTKDFIDPKIFLIEDYLCERKDQLLSRERFHIESMDCVNKCIPTRTKKEYNKIYQQDNKEILKIKKKEYQENNKETILKKTKEYRKKNKEQINKKANEKINCECGGKFCRANKSTHLKSKKHIKFLHTIPA